MVFIYLEYEELKRSKEAKGIGYKHFFQNELGNVLMKHGLKLATVFWREEAAVKVVDGLKRSAKLDLHYQGKTSLVGHDSTSDKGHNNMQRHHTTNLKFEQIDLACGLSPTASTINAVSQTINAGNQSLYNISTRRSTQKK